MKKWLFLLLILATGATVTAQNYTNPNPGTYGFRYNRLKADSTLLIPTVCGTPTLKSSVTNQAGIAYDSCNNKFYLWNPKVGGGWTDVGSAPDSTVYATVWRLVNDSTILRNLINGKVNIADTLAMLSGYQRSGNPVTVAAQPNITSLGTLTGLTVSGLITAGTISSTITQPIQPNITTVGTLSNLTVAGSVNAANVTVSGTVTSGVISSTTGHINNLTVPGTITGGTFSGTLSSGTQAGITQLGTLSTLTVSGAITAGSVSATTITGTLATANQPNITGVGTLGSLNVTGTITAGTLSGALSAGAQNSITSLANLTAITVTGHINAGTISGTLLSTVPWSKITSTPTTLAGYGITDGIATTSTYYIGTTLITFNRASASQSLTGVSIDGNAGSATLWGSQAFASGSPVTPLYGMVFDNSTSQWRPATNTVLQTWLGYITGNQTITLSGDVSGSGTTAITTTIGAGKVTTAMMATPNISQWTNNSGYLTAVTGTANRISASGGTVDISSAYAGQATITIIGTLASGAVPYSLLTGTVPTWNQNTTGNAATATLASNSTQLGGYSPDAASNASTIARRDGNADLVARTYWMSNVYGDAAPGKLLSMQSGGQIQTASLAQVQSYLGLGSNAYTSTSFLPLGGGTMSGSIAMGGNNITGGGTATFTRLTIGATETTLKGDLVPDGNNTRDIGASGNNIRSAYFQRLETNATDVRIKGDLLAAIDNAYDIGASGANRPRNGYFSGSISGVNGTFTGVIYASTGNGITFNGATGTVYGYYNSGANNLIITNNVTSGFTQIGAGSSTLYISSSANTSTFSTDVVVAKSAPVTALQSISSITSGSRGDWATYNSGNSTVSLIRTTALTDNVGSQIEIYTRPAGGSLTLALTINSNQTATFAGLIYGPGASFSGSSGITVDRGASASATLLILQGTGAGYNNFNITNTGGSFWGGVMRDDGIAPFSGGSAYAGYIGTSNATDFIITTNATKRLLIGSAGAATFSSSVTATAFYESSDARYKTVVSRTRTAAGFDMIQYYWKKELGRDSLLHYGYEAQQVRRILPSMVKADEAGYLSVNYIEVLVSTITKLEARINQLEKIKK